MGNRRSFYVEELNAEPIASTREQVGGRKPRSIIRGNAWDDIPSVELSTIMGLNRGPDFLSINLHRS